MIFLFIIEQLTKTDYKQKNDLHNESTNISPEKESRQSIIANHVPYRTQ